jgi:adenylate cyclase
VLFGLLVIAFAPQFGPVTLVSWRGVRKHAGRNSSVYFLTHDRLLIDFTYP